MIGFGSGLRQALVVAGMYALAGCSTWIEVPLASVPATLELTSGRQIPCERITGRIQTRGAWQDSVGYAEYVCYYNTERTVYKNADVAALWKKTDSDE